MDHAFVIPAYRASPYLAECVATLLDQRPASPVLLTTSTPNEHIRGVARRFGLRIRVGGHRPGIAADWNFALTSTSAACVTVAHQDDVYLPGFVEQTMAAFGRHPDADLVFTAFSEHSSDGPRRPNLNLVIKRLLTRRGFGLASRLDDPARKRRLLSLGNPICCPSVTINRRRNPAFRFAEGFRSNLDWDAWERLAGADGSFVYLDRVLVSHRVHRATETTAAIASGARDVEDRAMLERFWPGATARLLARVYRLGYGANRG